MEYPAETINIHEGMGMAVQNVKHSTKGWHCGKKKQSLWFCGLQVLKEHNYLRGSTYMCLVR